MVWMRLLLALVLALAAAPAQVSRPDMPVSAADLGAGIAQAIKGGAAQALAARPGCAARRPGSSGTVAKRVP